MLFWHLGITCLIVFFTLGRRRVDYRVVLLGSILPDLVDKPLGRVFFEDRFETSRIFGHTFLFALVVLVLVFVLPGSARRTFFILPIAVLIHLMLDAMWDDPVTLFWPLFGTRFPPHPVQNYWLDVLLRPIEHPWELAKEVAGIAALVYLWVGHRMNQDGRAKEFVRSGRLG